ncbi:hypothetical protein [Mycolicibacterium canariasense]|uniref:hypothetical protein n=1 Tax=Mycolicibacterium canariasense TaxID=228230 RepID=UPI0010424863|nr:hypothetical protein [Mycolicibacterium canariasense]MCV7213031.1 hypothetical protein [Mycolicibacterium canariasense]
MEGQLDNLLDDQNLREAMGDAYRQAKTQQGSPEDKLTYLVAAAAAVMLVRQRRRIFCRNGEPQASAQKLSDTMDYGYIIGSSLLLAMAVLEDFNVDIPVDAQPQMRTSLLNHLSEVDAQEVARYPTPNAVATIARCLQEFKDLKSLAAEVPAPPPERGRFSAGHLAAAGTAAAVVFAVIGGLVVSQVTPVREFSGGETDAAASTGAPDSTGVPVDPITFLPKRPPAVTLSQTLPNTDVQLFAFPDSADPSGETQTVPGYLPPVGAPVMAINDRLTFEVRLSIRDKELPPDTLSLSINAVTPTVITESKLLANRDHAEEFKPTLNVGDPVAVPPIAKDGTSTVYRFVLAALPSKPTENGYWCGYTPKPVSILVTKGDNYESAITSYPVYVMRDELVAGAPC